MKHFPHYSQFIPALLSGIKTIELRPHAKPMYLPGEICYIGEDYMMLPAPKVLGPGHVYHINGEYTVLRKPSGHVFIIEPEIIISSLLKTGEFYKASTMPAEVARIFIEIETANGKPETCNCLEFPESWLWQLGLPFTEFKSGIKEYRDIFTGLSVDSGYEALQLVLERYYGYNGPSQRASKLMMRMPHWAYYYRTIVREFPVL